jgi:hypothetical protein
MLRQHPYSSSSDEETCHCPGVILEMGEEGTTTAVETEATSNDRII